MRAKVQYFILVLVVCILSLARADDFDISIKPVELTGELSADHINVIYADSLGFLWLGTSTGLYRWDGVKALKFFKESGSENVTAISQSPTGEFWIGCKDGSLAFTSQQKLISFQPVGYSNDTASVSDILINRNGNVWWSTYGSGVYCYYNHLMFSLNEHNGLTDNYVYEIAFGEEEKVWAATDNGVNVFYLDTLSNTLVPEAFPAELPDLIVQTLVRDHEGFMWFGFHQEGIGYYDPQTKMFYKIKDINDRHLSKVISLSMQNLDVWIVDSQHGLFYSKTSALGYSCCHPV